MVSMFDLLSQRDPGGGRGAGVVVVNHSGDGDTLQQTNLASRSLQEIEKLRSNLYLLSSSCKASAQVPIV